MRFDRKKERGIERHCLRSINSKMDQLLDLDYSQLKLRKFFNRNKIKDAKIVVFLSKIELTRRAPPFRILQGLSSVLTIAILQADATKVSSDSCAPS